MKYLDDEVFKNLKNDFPDKWINLKNKLEYPYECFNNIEDYQKLFDILEKEDFFKILKKQMF